MSTPSVITIDGPAGSGKSTLGERLARRLGYLYFDTGVMYRALAWAALQHNVDPASAPAVAELARRTEIQVLPPATGDGRQYTVLVDGVDVTWELRRPEVERIVSIAAKHPEVRALLRARQREIGRQGRVVMVGRDIGAVVVPDAPVKLYLDASVDERARRRTSEIQSRGGTPDIQHIRAEIIRRDELDRHVSAPAVDACVIVSDGLTPEEVAELAFGYIQRATDDRLE